MTAQPCRFISANDTIYTSHSQGTLAASCVKRKEPHFAMNASLTLLLSLLCASVATAAEPVEWDVVYSGDKLPTECVPKWWGNEGPNTEATVTPDGLHIVDRGTVATNLRCYSKGWAASPKHPAVIEATVRVVSCTSRAGMCLLAANGVNEEVLTLYPDRIELMHAKLAHRMDTTDRHHTYRIRISGSDVTACVDGEPVIDGKGKFSAPAHKGRCYALFGSLSSASTGEGYWRQVKLLVELPPVTTLPGARHVVIYKKKDVYACFPNFSYVEGSRLAVSFGTRARRSHIDGTGGSATYVSDDAGETWRPTQERFLHPRHLMPWGEYLTCSAGGWKEEPASKRKKLEAKGLWVRPVREGVVAHGGRPGWVRKSKDGKDWTTRRVPTPRFAFMQAYGPPGFLVTSKQTVLYSVYGKRTVAEDHSSLVMRSADRGQTWEWPTIAAVDAKRLGFSETALFENDAGEIGAMLRPSPEGPNNTYVSFSSDDAKTWSAAKDAGFWGYPCDVIKLSDGTLLCSYGYRRDRMGIRCRLSRDGGHTWGDEIVLRADGWGNGGDMGYPRSIQLPDGHIFTLYYINLRDNITHVAGTHWRVP